MTQKKFLLLQSNPMFQYTLGDIENTDNVVIFHKKRVSENTWTNFLFNLHNSGKIQKYVELPFKGYWDKRLFDDLLDTFTPDYIVFTVSWYSDHLVRYFREKCKDSKLIFRFTDKISNGLGNNYAQIIERIKLQFDGVLVYSQEDARQYGFTYHSVGYSVYKECLSEKKPYDVIFVGADKGRIEKIRQAYNIFKSSGLSCFFYVTQVKQVDRKDDGMVYADKPLSFCDYMSYVKSSKCLFELIQEGSSGRTFRMMESIMYNKLLITNCTEIEMSGYYNPEYVLLYKDVADINPSFVVHAPSSVDFHYCGDFSPRRVLVFMSHNW